MADVILISKENNDLSPEWNMACQWAKDYCRRMFNKDWNDNSIAGEYMAARSGYIAGHQHTSETGARREYHATGATPL